MSRSTSTIVNKKLSGVHEVTETTKLDAQVDNIHQMMKAILTPLDMITVEHVTFMIDAAEIMFIMEVHTYMNFVQPICVY